MSINFKDIQIKLKHSFFVLNMSDLFSVTKTRSDKADHLGAVRPVFGLSIEHFDKSGQLELSTITCKDEDEMLEVYGKIESEVRKYVGG